jgi:hypothetical protein
MKKVDNLFDIMGVEEDGAWVGMPEYKHSENPQYAKEIVFRFRNEEDLKQFSKLIGQKLTMKTKSAWFPELESDIGLFRYVQQE